MSVTEARLREQREWVTFIATGAPVAKSVFKTWDQVREELVTKGTLPAYAFTEIEKALIGDGLHKWNRWQRAVRILRDVEREIYQLTML